MSVTLCARNTKRQELIKEYAEALKTEAHLLGTHGLDEAEFYRSGLFRGAIEKIRGEFSATMSDKREFARHVFNHLQDHKFIENWEQTGGKNRYDYLVYFKTGRTAAIELKGCLDGNNTTIFERPHQAQEFVIWGICTNPGSDPQHNAWSGLHTRLSAELVTRGQQIDGVILLDMLCGTINRRCPKVEGSPERITAIAQHQLPPPCIYVFPATAPHARNNPHPVAQRLGDVALLDAFHKCFGGNDDEVNYVDFDVEYRGSDTVRRTRVWRAGAVVQESKLDAIGRT